MLSTASRHRNLMVLLLHDTRTLHVHTLYIYCTYIKVYEMGFIKGRTPGKLTCCEDDFARLV